MATRTLERPVSARNQWSGRIRELIVEKDGVLAEVVLECGDQELVSVITKESAERLGLKVGDVAYAMVKATDVMIGR